MANIQADPTFSKQKIDDLKEAIVEELQQLTLLSTAGAHAAVAATAVQVIFVAPRKCVITSIKVGATTSVAAHSSNYWEIQVVNQTGDLDLLSKIFSGDDDVTAANNGKRAITADTMLEITNTATADFLQNAALAQGDILIMTLTKNASASNLTFSTCAVRYKVVD